MIDDEDNLGGDSGNDGGENGGNGSKRGPAVPRKRPRKTPQHSYTDPTDTLLTRCSATISDARPQSSIRCRCDLEAARNTTKKGPNTGRAFYACPKESKRAQCGFFQWADDGTHAQQSHSRASSAPQGRMGRSAAVRSTPRHNAARRIDANNNTDARACFNCGKLGHWANSCRS